jgi:hypothetical protein
MYTDKECWAVRCDKKPTHTVKVRIAANDVFPEREDDTSYCLEHALYFAAWLPYCYPDEYTLIGIYPPASELFQKSTESPNQGGK